MSQRELIRSFGQNVLVRLTSDRFVRAAQGPPTRLDALPITEAGTVV